VRQLSVTTTIAAPPAVVWEVLTDTAGHSAWNPFLTEFAGELAVGRRLRVRIAPPGGRAMTFRPVVTAAEPERELAWLGRAGLPGLFDGAHSFTLAPRPDGGTELTQSERFRGLLVPLMRTALRRTEAGFTAMNEALRDRAESMAGQGAPTGVAR
jgi:hypothetical protein